MLLVKTYLDTSAVHGIGLFSVEKIKKGTIIYKKSPQFDIKISESDFKNLDALSQKHISYYGYFDKRAKQYYLAFDNIRFVNHSIMSNISIQKSASVYQLVALCDINPREELLQDYNEFEELRDGLE